MTATLTDRDARERHLTLLRERMAREPIWKPLPGPQTMAYNSAAVAKTSRLRCLDKLRERYRNIL